jgi:outer membrane protein assembly factor BamB
VSDMRTIPSTSLISAIPVDAGEPTEELSTTISRRTLLSTGAGFVAAALLAKAARVGAVPANVQPVSAAAGTDSWRLPAHDLGATRLGGPVAGARRRWHNSLEGGVPGAAAIVGDRVFAASLGGVMASFELGSGRERWRRALGTAVYGTGQQARQLGFFGGAAVVDGRVVAASERVFCLDAASGRTLWSSKPLRTSSSDDYFWGPPVITGGLVLVGSGSGAELPTARGRLSAYSLRDGTLVWSTPMVPEGGNGGGVIAPASVDRRAGIVYVATGSPYQAVPGDNPGTCSLVSLRLRNGSITWVDQVHKGDSHGFDFNSAPVIVGRLLVAAGKDGFYGWDRVAHRRLWHRQITPALSGGSQTAGPTDGPEGGPVATDGERVYVLSNDAASQSCAAAALEPSNGRVVWQRRLPSFSFAAPALAGDRLCTAGADGTLRLLSKRNGRVAAKVALGDPSTCPPAAAHGRLVVGTGSEPFLPGKSLICIE